MGHNHVIKMDSKSKIENELVSIVEFCQKQLDELNTTKFKHPQLADLRNQYISQLRTIIEEFINLTNLIRNEIIWDHLVVAFFGETNAGKSTLIETLRLNYGVADTNSWNHSEIVGDGQADYTKDATEYDIVINGKRVTLIDVPGIEGEEAKYADVIEKALRKAHVVFYVQGKNKKPDAKIAQKIGRYLSDWSRVYSIYNVRNSLDDYDPEMLNSVPDSLKTERNTDLQEQIQEVLKGILGNVYQGGLMLHGLVGLSVSSDFEHSAKWHNIHTQSLRLFGSIDKALEFSNIAEWISLMNVCSDDFEKVIIGSNRQKIIGLKIKGMRMLKSIEKNQNNDIENLTNRLYSLKNSVISTFSNSIRNAKQRPTSVVNQILNKLKSDLVNIVNSESDTDQKVRRAKSLSTNAKYTLNSAIENGLLENADTLKRNLKKQFSEFKDISLRVPILPDVTVSELDLDIEDAFENLEVSFADVCITATSMAGSAAAGAGIGTFFCPGIGTLIGAGVGAIVGAVGRGVMSDGGRADTVQAIGKEIEICKESAKKRIKQSISNIVSGLQDSQRRATKIIDNELASINDLAESLNIIYQKFTLR